MESTWTLGGTAKYCIGGLPLIVETLLPSRYDSLAGIQNVIIPNLDFFFTRYQNPQKSKLAPMVLHTTVQKLTTCSAFLLFQPHCPRKYWDTASKCAMKPLSTRFGNFIMYGHFPSHFLLFYYSFIAQMVCGAFHSTTNIFLISRAIMLCFIYSFSFILLYTCSLTISRHKQNMPAHFRIYT